MDSSCHSADKEVGKNMSIEEERTLVVQENGLSWDLCVKDDARFGGNFAADIHCRQVVFV